jgi:hypothetical protein
MDRAHRNRRRALPLLAVLVAVLLSGCASHTVQVPWLDFAVRVPGATPAPLAGAPSHSSSTPGAPNLQPTGPQPTIEQFVPVAERFVEEHRGLRFKSHVQVTLLDDAAFRERLLGKSVSAADQQALATSGKELKALHLVDKGVDLNTATRSLLGAGVSGFYDPKSKSLVVRGVSATPYVREVLVHELTHALQDQWFGIDRPSLNSANDEQGNAFQAVFEGDAVRIQKQYHASMTPLQKAQSTQEESSQGGGPPTGVPQVLLELISFPYIVGPAFVDALQATGGQPKVDDAFVHPPTTSAQLIDIHRYLAGDKALPVPPPKADATTFDQSVLGEFGLLLLFEKVGSITPQQAVKIGNLWGGDQYVAWDSPSGACVRDAMLAKQPSDQHTLDDALASFAAAVPGTTFAPSVGGAPAVLTACG